MRVASCSWDGEKVFLKDQVPEVRHAVPDAARKTEHQGGFWSDIGEKVLERLAASDKTTIVIERQPDGKMRVSSESCDGEKIMLKDQVVEVRTPDRRRAPARRSQNQAPRQLGPADPGLRPV
jgi:hypothetical protein